MPSIPTESLKGISSGTGTGSGEIKGSFDKIFGSSTGGTNSLAGILGALGSTGPLVTSVTNIVSGGSLGGGTGSEAAVGAAVAIGSLAAVGVGVHSVANAGIQLPPLPRIDVPAVCALPQEAIDFLKDNGSMEQQECEPEDEETN
ncbi:MAG TPA: hypothetical protein GX694_06015 [Actinomycetales bacterium]|nr:hypothetical protein [Actinomycetales bacterium]